MDTNRSSFHGCTWFCFCRATPNESCENLRYRGVVTVKWRQFVVSETRCAWKMPGNHLVPLNGIFILHTWFQKLFKSHPYLGNGSNLTNMLQTGSNHQLVASISLILLFFAIFLPLSRGTYDKCMFYTFINGLTGMTQHHTGLNFQNMWPLWQWQMRFVFTWWIHIFPETNIY